MLDLALLRAFISVAENSSFTRAGAELFRSQSAISMQIQRLEDRLGVELFRRSSKRLELTPEGEVLLSYASRILQLVDEAFSAVVVKKTTQANVRIGCLEDYASYVLPDILAKFWQDHPDIYVEASIDESSELLKRLGDDFDIVMVMQPAGLSKGQILCEDKLNWMTAFGGSAQDTVPLPVAFRPEGCDVREWASLALDSIGRPWQCVYLAPGIAMLHAAVKEGLAVGVFKESMIGDDLRRLGETDGFPALPTIEIALHTAPESQGRRGVAELTERITAAIWNRQRQMFDPGL
ncbi:MAG TPA: LysR family transcriptional regulator [Bosea sp. (in: a-proteobacteria)]|jgi:DNA-binding transcriptional LysR family regulator|nr:LysR family transcriptional regulator [Bosea sp. (in: a-proteobacteria)]